MVNKTMARPQSWVNPAKAYKVAWRTCSMLVYMTNILLCVLQTSMDQSNAKEGTSSSLSPVFNSFRRTVRIIRRIGCTMDSTLSCIPRLGTYRRWRLECGNFGFEFLHRCRANPMKNASMVEAKNKCLCWSCVIVLPVQILWLCRAWKQKRSLVQCCPYSAKTPFYAPTLTMNTRPSLSQQAFNTSHSIRIGVNSRGVYHIQNVNAYHSRLKGWLQHFRGVTT